MAYEQNSSYEPPRRAYMEQHSPYFNSASQQGPDSPGASLGQPGHIHNHQEQRMHENRGHEYGFDQARDVYREHGHVAGYDNTQTYGQFYQQDEDKAYDTRRRDRDPSQGNHARPQPSQRGQNLHGRPGYHGAGRGLPVLNHRPPPRVGSSPRDRHEQQSGNRVDDQRPRGPYGQRGGHLAQVPGVSDQWNRSAIAPPAPHFNQPHAAPAHSQARAMPQHAGKPGGERNSRENARMNADARVPKSLPFDHFNPSFGSTGPGPSDQRPSGNQAIYNRPHTSNGNRPGQAFPQGNSRQYTPFGPAGARENGLSTGPRQGFEQHDLNLGQNRLHQQPKPPPIDMTHMQQSQRPVYTEHHPLTPVQLPPRPSTSQGQRPGQYAAAYFPLRKAQTDHECNFSPNPWAQDQHARDTKPGDIYAEYDGTNGSPTRPVLPISKTREEEIEAEMPNFDNAVSGQNSSTQDRMQDANPPIHTFHAAPPIQRSQTAPADAVLQSRPTPGFDHQQPHPYSAQYVGLNRQLPPQAGFRGDSGLRGPPMRGATLDGYGGGSTSAARGHGPYDMSCENMPGPGPMRNLPYGQAAMLPLSRTPYSNGPHVGRPLDDPRQMSARQDPSQPQRAYQESQRPREELPPQQRSNPDYDNNEDALPHHPTPARLGHTRPGQQMVSPSPTRDLSGPGTSQAGPQQRAPADYSPKPVTQAEIERLRAAVEASENPRQELFLVKRLSEASIVLANENGRADAKTAAQNRERFVNEARKRLKKLVGAGYPDAMFHMADCYGQGAMGLESDTKEAFKLYQAAAKAGHAQAAFRMAVCCEIGPEGGGGTNKDHAKAVQWYRRAATLGDAAAMYKLGAILLKGLLGQQKNNAEAIDWLKRGADLADQENPHALHELATLYESTNQNPEIRSKIAADDRRAGELYQKAAQLGYRNSQFRLGQAYEYGALGLAINNRNSIAWYTKAAAQGEHEAELSLSGWYLTGADGILEQSDTEAYLWARKAASSEPPFAKAMFAMGYFTESGIGCPASLEEAKKWYGRAAAYKFPKAVERLEEMRANAVKAGAKNAAKALPSSSNSKLLRKDQKKDEENCVVM